MDVLTYDGEVPVSDETVREWIDRGVTRVRIHFVASLMDMVNCTDIDDWNNFVDEVVGTSLVDSYYGFAKAPAEDSLGDANALLFIEGDIDTEIYGQED